MKIYAIDPRILENVWDDVKGYIKRAIDRSPPTHSLENVRKEIEIGQSVLYVIGDDKQAYGAAVACVMVYPQLRSVRVRYVGGDRMKDWLKELRKVIDIFALENDCQYIESVGRGGWKRAWGCYSAGELLYRRLYG